MQVIIAIGGCDGTGKTHMIERCRLWMASLGLRVAIVDKWDILRPGAVPACDFICSTRENLGSHITRMPSPARMHFIFWMITVTAEATFRRMQGSTDVFLLDGYWMKHAAAEIEYGTPPAVIEAVTATLPKADITIILDTAPAIALERKHRAATVYECGLDVEARPVAFIAHQAAVRTTLQRFAATHGWCQVDASSTENEVWRSVRRVLEPEIQSRLTRKGHPVQPGASAI